MTLNHSVSRNPLSSLVGLLFVVLICSFSGGMRNCAHDDARRNDAGP